MACDVDGRTLEDRVWAVGCGILAVIAVWGERQGSVLGQWKCAGFMLSPRCGEGQLGRNVRIRVGGHPEAKPVDGQSVVVYNSVNFNS